MLKYIGKYKSHEFSDPCRHGPTHDVDIPVRNLKFKFEFKCLNFPPPFHQLQCSGKVPLDQRT